MFSGIVQKSVEIVSAEETASGLRLGIQLCEEPEIGASVSVDGVCLTVTEVKGESVFFDVIFETLGRTTLGALQIGDRVNVERALCFGEEIGGHLVSGHVLATTQLLERRGETFRFSLPESCRAYLFLKGYIAVDGVSLTISECKEDFFEVSLIPETLARTTLGKKQGGDSVNIEVDALTQAAVETVQRLGSIAK